MSLTRKQTRDKLYLAGIPGLGFAGTADSIAAGTLTDTFRFQDSEDGEGQWEGAFIYRPSFTTDDRVKRAGTVVVSTGVLSHTGSNYANTSTLPYEIIGLVTPDELNECVTRALRRVYFPTLAPVTPWVDGDFSSSATSDFSGTPTLTKVTTAAGNFSGFRSASIEYAGADYEATTPLEVTPGERWFLGAISKVSGSYSATWKVYDADSGVQIGATLTHSERAWQFMGQTYTIPSGTHRIEARMGCSAAGTVVWDTLPGHCLDAKQFTAPSWLDAPFKLYSLREADYRGPQVATGIWPASSRRFTDWLRPADYDTSSLVPEASPNFVEVNREEDLPEHDLWYHGLRPFSDWDTFPAADAADDSTTTSAPEDQFLAACKYELALILTKRYKGESEWVALLRENEAIIKVERDARQPATPRRQVTHVTPGGRR